MRSMRFAAACAAAGVVCVQPALAVEVYDNGAVSVSNPVDATNNIILDDFGLAADAVINTATVYLGDASQGGSNPGIDTWIANGAHLSWYIFEKDGSGVGDEVASATIGDYLLEPTGVTYNFGQIYGVTFDLGGDIDITGGQDYWFGVHADDDFTSPEFVFWANATGGGYGLASQQADGDDTSNLTALNGVERAFTLSAATAAVPLPAAAPLLGGGVLALGLLARRRKSG